MKMELLRRPGVLALILLAGVRIADAQRAKENAVAEASDAFGTTVGRETIGLYSPNSARGFNPGQAGNLRISGLYYDQVPFANLVPATLRGSTIHVGISAQGFPFPAPTGVVDFQLRTPGAAPRANALLGYASYDRAYGELGVEYPFAEELSIGAGVGYTQNNGPKFATHTQDWTAGAIAHWRPTDAVEISPFFGASRHREHGERALVFIGHSGAPEYRAAQVPGQPWARFGFDGSNIGTTLRARLSGGWLLDAGIFRSASRILPGDEAFLTDTNELGEGDYSLSGSPSRSTRSTSGEIRLAKRIDTPRIRNNLYFNLRGRRRSGESGGADVLELGRATVTQIPLVPEYEFHPGPTTLVTARQITPGIAYEGIWRNVGQLSLGIQKSFYQRTIAAPATAEISTRTSPWLYNGGGAVFVTKKLSIYASSTRGFEEIGAAPTNAVNRDEAVPAQMTKQVDAGFKYQLNPRLQLVAGVFKIDKPYFALDQSNIFRQIGAISNRGAEVSFSGALTERFTVVAGLIRIDPKVERESVGSTREESVAIGPKPRFISANLQYRPAFLEGLVLDAKIERVSSRYARYPNVRLPAATTLDGGVRYNTRMFGKAATWRLQLFNLTNEFRLNPNSSGEVEPLEARRFEISLATDF